MVQESGIGKTLVELGKSSGAFASGRDFIQRNFPPGYRDPALKLVRAFEQAATGAGLYQIVTEFNNAIFQAQNGAPPYTQYQTYNRPSRRNTRGHRYNNRFGKRCRCPSTRKRFRSRNRF